MLILAIILSILFIVILLMMLPVKITLDVILSNRKWVFHVAVNVLRIRLYKKEWHKQVASIEETFLDDILETLISDREYKKTRHWMQDFIHQCKNLKLITVFILQHLVFHKIKWVTHFGTGEASSTGIVTGGLWTIKETSKGLLYKIGNVSCNPNVSVIPYFQHKLLRTEFHCMFSIKIAKAISIFMRVNFIIALFKNTETYRILKLYF
ncbi:MAG TPA: DUF2953 domain-containing protein [Candidatus Avamphibacillus sp.]|nr:DUF2953 domain-containing protein [Candidatus Avamphibacillus sp.]